MKIAIIGFGAAAIGFIERFKEVDTVEIHVFEKSPDIFSSSISGIRADGKLFVSDEMGGDIQIDADLQRKIVDYYVSQSGSGQVERGSSFFDMNQYRKFYEQGFLPVRSDYYHLGTDQLQKVLKNIYDSFSSKKHIFFHFSSEIENIAYSDQSIEIKGQKFDKVLVAVGRSGHRLIDRITKQHPGIIKDNTTVDLGVRLELPDHIVEELNKEMYEFKIKYKSRTGYMVRTFCNNPSGFVVVENYGDFSTVNGHAKLKQKSTNTNFAILTTVQLTEPFNDPVGYGSHIAKLTNILAGEGKVILQTYQQFKDSKRTKNLYRVIPTLSQEHFITGDINLAFPRRIIESIIDFIENLDRVIPGVANHDNLIYAPEIKFYSNVLDNSHLKNLHFIGDCSGLTRSITYATAHGYMVADEIAAKKVQ